MTAEERRLYNIFSARKAEFTSGALKGKRFDTSFKKVYSFYLKNKERIDSRLQGVKEPGKAFMQKVFERMDETIGTRKSGKKHLGADAALKKEFRSETFLSYTERAKENVLHAVRSDEDSYYLWRKFTRHQKIDKDKFVYVGDNTYQYSTKNWNIYIKIENSPEMVKVWKEKV